MTLERRTLLRGLSAVPLVAGMSALGGVESAMAEDAPADFPEPTRELQLYAVKLEKYDGEMRLGYGTSPDKASYPGPTIEMLEGECIAITLHNEVPKATLEKMRKEDGLPLGVSLHPHGVRYKQSSDGTLHSDSWVKPGKKRTYIWYARPADKARGIPGTAGYWWYHDHLVGTMHGTGGVTSGLFGALIIRRKDDPLPDHTYVTAMGDGMTLNLRRYPDTDTYEMDNPKRSNTSIVANQGERIEFVNIALGSELHTWHLHGHSWADTRTGLLGDVPWADDIRTIDNKTIGPGDAFGFQVFAGELSGPGHWMLHCHLQTHSDMGMSTFFHVHKKNGDPPPGHPPTHGGGMGGMRMGNMRHMR